MKSWKRESDWVPYFKKLSNAKLLEHKKGDQSVYRGTVITKVVNKEIARRKAAGQMRKTAGRTKTTRRNPFGYLPF